MREGLGRGRNVEAVKTGNESGGTDEWTAAQADEGTRGCKSSQNTCCCFSHYFHIWPLGCSRTQGTYFTRQLKHMYDTASCSVTTVGCRWNAEVRNLDKTKASQSNRVGVLQGAENYRENTPNIRAACSHRGVQMWFTEPR